MKIEKQIRADFKVAGGMDAVASDILYVSEITIGGDPKLYAGDGDEEPSIDCRLRWYDGIFSFVTGLSDYDQDHRGHWGCSCVVGGMTEEDARSMGLEMLEQVLESACKESGAK